MTREALQERTANLICTLIKKTARGETNLEFHEEKERLEEEGLRHVDAYGPQVIRRISPGATDAEVARKVIEIKKLGGIAGVSLFWAIDETSELEALTSKEFLDWSGKMDFDMVSAIFYEMWLHKSISIVDPRVMKEGTMRFWSSLNDVHAFSEWVGAMLDTGNIAALTRPQTLSAILELGKNGAKIAGNFSLAIGATDETDKLTGRGFIERLQKLSLKGQANILARDMVHGKHRPAGSRRNGEDRKGQHRPVERHRSEERFR